MIMIYELLKLVLDVVFFVMIVHIVMTGSSRSTS